MSEKKEKIVSDYFKKTQYDLHIVDMFFRSLADNEIRFFSVDSTGKDTKVSIVNQKDIDSSPKVSTTSKKVNGDRELDSSTNTEGSEEESTTGN